MASSGTYAFAPDNADLIAEAFERCKVDPATLVARHFKAGIAAINYMFSDWANDSIKLFAVDEQTQTLTQGTASYTAATGTLLILEAVIRRSSLDTPVYMMTREQYELLPDKTQQGLPTQVWHDRRTGLYYPWQVPENSTDVFRYNRLRRLQDAGTGLETPDLPYRWFNAMAAGMAARLAEKFAPPELEDRLLAKAALALKRAIAGDTESVDVSFGVGRI